jgi:cholesterol transport system auxiliary component
MKKIAKTSTKTWPGALFLLFFLGLTGCALPDKAARPMSYDFGPGPLTTPPSDRRAPLPALVLAEVQAGPALGSPAMLYRLLYADAQQLQPYALARWSMPPAELLRQRLADTLGQRRALLGPGDGASTSTGMTTLRLTLEEFSQLFDSPQQSRGLLRLRATVSQAGPGGEQLLAQRSIIVQRPAPSADAAGGVRALSAATDAAAEELVAWLAQQGR